MNCGATRGFKGSPDRSSDFQSEIRRLKNRRYDRSEQLLEGRAEMVDHIARKQRFFARAVVKDCNLSGAPAEPGAETGGVERGEFLRKESGADAGERVAHSACGHAGIAGRVVAQ